MAGYAPSYYPNGARVGDASEVTVGSSQQVDDAVIHLTPTRLARVEGTVGNSARELLSNVSVMLLRDDGLGEPTTVAATQTNVQGGFKFQSVAPGDYMLLSARCSRSRARQQPL